MKALNIVLRKAAELIPYINNAKEHSEDQVKLIASSIKEFGFNNPVLLDGENGIIAGHGRVKAAELLGLDAVPTIELAHLSDTQKRAYILADNRTAEVGTEWDMQLVQNELLSLQDDGFNIELTGFDDNDIICGDEVDFPALRDGDKEPLQQMTFTLHDEQVAGVHEAINKAKSYGDFDSFNENSNGNALARICETYNRLG